MSVLISGQKKTIGLALSGGGFRAAAFHLGVMRKLQELGLLEKIDVLSCVSGGSIIGAFMAVRWTDPSGRVAVLDEFETYLATKSISVSTVLWGLLDPFHSRLDKLRDSYDEDLFHEKTLHDLKDGPRVYLNSTNLVTGNMFSFIAGGGSREEMGDWKLGKVPAPGFLISRAVAASSAFPPVYPPLRLDKDEYDRALRDQKLNDTEPQVHYAVLDNEQYAFSDAPRSEAAQRPFVALTDGGVYDNLGVQPLLSCTRPRLDYLIVSDGGRPFELDPQPAESGLGALKDSLGIMMDQIRGLEFSRLAATIKPEPGGRRALWFSIDSQNGEEIPGDARAASRIPTDLASLDDEQRAVLRRHGGALVLARINEYAQELLD
jgi:NTE family protein